VHPCQKRQGEASLIPVKAAFSRPAHSVIVKAAERSVAFFLRNGMNWDSFLLEITFLDLSAILNES
jgi:hypothetical protein